MKLLPSTVGVFAKARSSLASTTLDPIWEELFPAEQARIVRLLVSDVVVHPDGLQIQLRADGLESLALELRKDDIPV